MTGHRVAAITGSGSGIGRELALACAREGMALALADIDIEGLAATEALARTLGVPTFAQKCDVARAGDVEAFAASCEKVFGGVDWLFNNAGVAVLGPAWTATDADWEWVLGVNLRGVANGVRSFVPRMRARGVAARVINTASAAGLATLAGSAVYCASKHAVVAFSECLARDLEQAGDPIGVSVLCPSLVPTQIHQAQRSRPAHLSDTVEPAAAYNDRVRLGMAASPIDAADVAAATLAAVHAGRFYVIPHVQTGGSIRRRMDAMLGDFDAQHTGVP
ncbi:SDR family NAD(P)-dependent oxidoreductase [Variovorax sp. efr-133-TYG-130]|jgi:NAD(P)-dependent dehydrogenase (short-subunit alcohol dehydrogenase family)|uniref:SDR family NAD(P)-dependent oxidoreductase n=1 Tax=Variovorax sp. efr-133-TYG-130 TaxID=3040327 RepID=UPI0025535993|nr:SDR family NAD(P)-dependent oxidoreductase [Variovorax sp. efr-133-TYG-130]